MNADCIGCWSATEAAHDPAREWLFDWIAPSAQSADAPMSAAALTAAAERMARAGRAASTGAPSGAPSGATTGATTDATTESTTTRLLRTRLPQRPRLQLRVQSGPAWNGYFGLQVTIRGQAPAGATAWMALVEPLPVGTDGSGLTRELMRSVTGPLPLRLTTSKQALTHLAALRAPDGALPERLRARAWIEGADGRILAVASDACTAIAN